MTDTMALDPSRGFVALPLDVLEIEMSPGAFRTLVEFCRMANDEGLCWPSLEQLGTRLARSRAAISGYIGELRELSLVETETQRTANGFNYRLRYRVTFWSRWKARFRRPADRAPVERRVHPAERQYSENQIQGNQAADPGSAGPDPVDLNRAWLARIAGAPYPAFTSPPPEDLIAQTRASIARRPVISADMKPVLSRFFANRGVPLPPELLADLTSATDRISALPNAQSLLEHRLREAWRPHWRLPPSRAFLDKIVAQIAQENPAAAAARLLSGHLRRWELSRKSLRCAA